MAKIAYPKWKYNKEGKGRIVVDEKSEQALGPGWENSPAKFGVVTAPGASAPTSPVGEEQIFKPVTPQPKQKAQ